MFTFSKFGLEPEGLDYSRKHGFLVGSVGLGVLHKIGLDGSVETFSETGNLVSSIGIQVDEANDLIYVTNNHTPFPPTTPEASIVVVDLDDGSIVSEISVSELGPAGAVKFLNDLDSSIRLSTYIY